MTRAAFDAVGGFPEVAIGEEFGFSRALRRVGPIIVLPQRVHISPRRLRSTGIVRSTLRNWMITSLYHAGVSPEVLARRYPAVR